MITIIVIVIMIRMKMTLKTIEADIFQQKPLVSLSDYFHLILHKRNSLSLRFPARVRFACYTKNNTSSTTTTNINKRNHMI